MPDIDARTFADLPDRCENCGAELTDAEKRVALETGATPVLCSICTAEQAPADEYAAADELDVS